MYLNTPVLSLKTSCAILSYNIRCSLPDTNMQHVGPQIPEAWLIWSMSHGQIIVSVWTGHYTLCIHIWHILEYKLKEERLLWNPTKELQLNYLQFIAKKYAVIWTFRARFTDTRQYYTKNALGHDVQRVSDMWIFYVPNEINIKCSCQHLFK